VTNWPMWSVWLVCAGVLLVAVMAGYWVRGRDNAAQAAELAGDREAAVFLAEITAPQPAVPVAPSARYALPAAPAAVTEDTIVLTPAMVRDGPPPAEPELTWEEQAEAETAAFIAELEARTTEALRLLHVPA
jgi:hypothetical protein